MRIVLFASHQYLISDGPFSTFIHHLFVKVLPEATTIHLHVRVENMMCSIQNSPEKKR